MLAALNSIDPTAARPLLQEALKDRDWAVRVRAATLLREQGVAAATLDAAMRPAPPGRPMDDAERQALLNPAFSPHAFIETDRGTIEIELAILDAPLTVANFIALARKDFFNGVAIHRVVPDFVVQDGDPRGDGEGGPGYTIRDEINQRPYLRGTVGMALDWEDTGGSQFFITHSPQPHLDGRYTVFGHVVDGMDGGGCDPAVGHRAARADLGRDDARNRLGVHEKRGRNVTPPFMANGGVLPLLRRLLLRALAAFFAICNPPLHWFGFASARPTTRRTLPPGTSARMSATPRFAGSIPATMRG